MKLMIAALAALACTASAAFAQDKTPEEVAAAAAAASARATALVEANTRPIAFDGGLSGPGADFLRDQTQKAQFVLLGEGHNDHDTPLFAGALFDGLRDWRAFDTLVVEIDPVAVDTLKLPANRGKVEAAADLARRYPNHIGFASDQDLELMAHAAGVADLWGVEQVQGAQPLLEELVPLAPNDAVRAQVEALLTQVKSLETRRDQFGAFLHGDAETLPRLQALTTAFAAAPGSRAAFLLETMTTSAEIYSYYRRARAGEPVGLFNNTVREALMKRLFLRQYRAAEAAGRTPRALFKMGAWHMYRGRNPNQAFPIGNFVHEFAISNDAEDYGVYVVALGENYADVTDLSSWMAPLIPTKPDQPVVIDLRALQPTAKLFIDQVPVEQRPALRDFIYAFDALVILPNSQKASFDRTGFPER
ncbi:hypothetical protein [Brevundimonas bullata]